MSRVALISLVDILQLRLLYTLVFGTLLSVEGRFCRLIKIYSLMLKDAALSFHFEQVPLQSMQRVISVPKVQLGGQTDRYVFSFI